MSSSSSKLRQHPEHCLVAHYEAAESLVNAVQEVLQDESYGSIHRETRQLLELKCSELITESIRLVTEGHIEV